MSDESVFVEYRVLCEYGYLKHPAAIVETQSLASVPMAPPNYKHALPSELLRKTQSEAALSGIQLDAILLAGESHAKQLKFKDAKVAPVRRGFVIGDGTGVGKGRELAGVILDNFLQGRPKSVWISCSQMLLADACRDITDITRNLSDVRTLVVHGITPSFEKLQFESGVLFCTYATLASMTVEKPEKRPAGRVIFKRRIEQIVDWLGGADFDGCLIFDEAHKAKGYSESGDKSNISKVGEAVAELQNALPQARVVYVSATMATNIRDMEFMSRLGLWGTDTTAFKTPKLFFDFVEQRGVAGCEIVACEMKHRRLYLSRHLSLGNTVFNLVKTPSEPKMTDLYDKCAALWMMLINATPRQNRQLQSQLWATSQKFFKGLCISSKVPYVVKRIKEALEQNMAVVVGIQSTNESAYSQFRNCVYHSKKEIFSPCRTYLEGYILDKLKVASAEELGLTVKEIPVTSGAKAKVSQKEESSSDSSDDFSDISSSSSDDDVSSSDESSEESLEKNSPPNKRVKTEPAKKPECGVTHNASDSVRRKICELFMEVADKLPLNPLDEIQAEFGYENVAELTGRKRYQKLGKENNKFFVVEEAFIKVSSIRTVRDSFQEWTTVPHKKVAIISDAASTGISLHSSKSSKNQLKRLYIILEAPWTATSTCQQIGRTNRSNQAYEPINEVVMSAFPAEARFATSLAGRMESLGALCKGDRKSSHGSLWSEYEVPPKVAKAGVKDVLNCILGNDSNLNLFENERRAETQQKLREVISGMNMVCQNKKNESIPVASLTSHEKFLNRMLCVDLKTQSHLLKYLDLAVQNFQQDESSSIEELSSLIGVPFVETGRSSHTIADDDLSCTLIEYIKSDVLTYSGLIQILKGVTEPKLISLFVKDCIYGGRKKVCAAIKVNGTTPYYKVFRPSTNKYKKRARSFFQQKGFNKVRCMQDIKDTWTFEANYFSSGGCTKKYSTGICTEEPCPHKRPCSKFSVVAGGILKLWSNLGNLLSKPVRFVRHNDDNGQLLGVFVPQRKMNNIRSCVELHFPQKSS